MKVKELLPLLLAADPETELIVQKDSEGNSYSPLAGADPACVYVPESTYHGTVHSTALSAEALDMDVDEYAEVMALPRCVVLFPIN